MYRNAQILCLTIFKLSLLSQNFYSAFGFANVSSTTGTLDPGPPPAVKGLTFSTFSAHGVSSNPNASGRFSYTDWGLGAVNGSDVHALFTGNLDTVKYYEVSLRPANGYSLDVSSITFGFRRSGTGVRNYAVRSSADNFSKNLYGETGISARLTVLDTGVFFWKYDSVNISSDQNGSIILLDSTFTGITDTLAFRFYAWNSEAKGGTFSIDNVTFSGSAYDTVILPNPAGVPHYVNVDNLISIFPNPSAGRLIISTPVNEISEVELLSAAGKIIFVNWEHLDHRSVQIDSDSLESGIYLLRVHTKNMVLTRKIIIAGEK